MAPARKPLAAPSGPERRYFIVNPAGCIHEVDRDHAAAGSRSLPAGVWPQRKK
jgi:hypothetical protein